METWLHSVKLALDKKAQKSNITITSENMIKILGMGIDLTRMLEYLLATGNLRSKSGRIVCNLIMHLALFLTKLVQPYTPKGP